MRGIFKVSTAIGLTVALAACGTTRQAYLPPPSPYAGGGGGTPKATPSPGYKVGNPYQVAGVWYYPQEQPDYDETGIASWYGSEFSGRMTADGEVFDRNTISAAHPTLPMPVNVRVTNLENGRSIIVRVNDRGPYVNGRIIDLSERAADLLGYRGKGTARVRVTYISRAPINGVVPDDTPIEIASAVPAAPSAKVTSAPLPPISGVPVAPPKPVASLPKPAETETNTASEADMPDGQVTEVPVPAVTAIYVQAGAYGSAENAGKVAVKLYSLGARVIPVKIGNVTLYRVRIGPCQDVGQADTALAQVQALRHDDVKIVVAEAAGRRSESA